MSYRIRSRRRVMSLISLVVAVVIAYLQLQSSSQTPSLPASTVPAVAGAGPSPTGAVEAATDAVLSAQPGLAHVTKAIDGDTIEVILGGKAETVRFIGIDTPETHDPRKPVQCFGEAAAAHTKALLEGGDIRLEADPQDDNRDKYGRLLRYIYLPDGTLINAQLIRDGYAFAYTVFPYTKIDEFRALESEARQSGRGLWGGCNINESAQIKQTTGTK